MSLQAISLLMSRGLISYRRFVGSCFKMGLRLDRSIKVEICDETMGKMWRQPVDFSSTLIFGVCFSLRLLSYGDGDPSKPGLNLRGKHFLLLFCVIRPCLWENCVPKIDLTRAIFSTLGDCFGTPSLWRFLLVSILNYDWQMFLIRMELRHRHSYRLNAVIFQP